MGLVWGLGLNAKRWCSGEGPAAQGASPAVMGRRGRGNMVEFEPVQGAQQGRATWGAVLRLPWPCLVAVVGNGEGHWPLTYAAAKHTFHPVGMVGVRRGLGPMLAEPMCPRMAAQSPTLCLLLHGCIGRWCAVCV